MKKHLLIILVFALNFSFAQTDWTSYKNETFSISHPKSWSPDTSGDMNTKLILFSQLNGDNDLFKENVNVITQSLKGQNVSMTDFVKLTENQIETMVPNGKVWESKGTEERHYIVISGYVEKNDLKFKQLYVIKDEIIYIITFTALEEAYNDYSDIGSKILDSFKLN